MKSNKEIIREKLFPALFDPLYFTNKTSLDFIKECLRNHDLNKKRVIDVGCGIKPYKSLFTKTKKYIGTDIKDTGFADIICPNWKLKSKSNNFDSLLSSFVLEHTLYLEKSISEMRRVLKKDGFMTVIVPFVFPEHEAPHDYWRFTRFSLEKLFSSSEIVVLKPSNGYIITIATLVNLFINQTIKISLVKKTLFLITNIFASAGEFLMTKLLHLIYKTATPSIVYGKAYFSLPLNYLLVIRNKK